MFDQIMAMVREAGQQSVVENPQVPNEHNDAVMQEASSSITSSLQQVAQNGGPDAVQSLLNGMQSADPNHPAVQQVTNNLSGSLMEKFGLSSGAAQSVAGSLIPAVLGKIMGGAQNGGQTSGFNIGNIFSSIMGGAQGAGTGGGMMSNLSAIGAKFGLDKDGDGDVDMSDVMGMFKK